MNNMNIPFSPPDITQAEIDEVVTTLSSGWITTGPKTKVFEKELAKFLNVQNMVCLNSATAAMEMTLRLLGIGPGDEVIVPAYTYTATCSVITHVGAKPRIIDIQKDRPEIDYEQLKHYLNNNTKMVIAVDIAGIICDYECLYAKLEQYKHLYSPNNEIQKAFDRVIVMSDCAHGFGAMRNHMPAGQFADFTCFSFHAVKNLTTAEGGGVTWKEISGIDNAYVYQQYQILSLHGQTKDALAKTKLGSWEYDVISPAYKCNMTDLAAAIGLVQLKRYPELLKRRHEIICMYNEGFQYLPVQCLNHGQDGDYSSGHLYIIRIHGISEQQRNDIIVKMAQKGVACNVHYKPLPMLSAYQKMGFDIADFPNAYDFYHNEVTLPLYSRLTDEEVLYIIHYFKEIVGEYVCG